jgi:hypothetical protein
MFVAIDFDFVFLAKVSRLIRNFSQVGKTLGKIFSGSGENSEVYISGERRIQMTFKNVASRMSKTNIFLIRKA